MTEISFTTYTYHTDDSRPIQLDVWAPPNYSPQIASYKTIIYFHGGGLVSGYRRARFLTLALSLLNQHGWLVLTADYHLLPESEVSHIQDDVVALEEWISKHAVELGADLEN